MRLVSYTNGAGPAAGVLDREEIVPLSALGASATTVRGALESLDADALRALGEQAAGAGERLALAEVQLSAPVVDPEKIVCIGLNYRDHAEESKQEIPQAPMWF